MNCSIPNGCSNFQSCAALRRREEVAGGGSATWEGCVILASWMSLGLLGQQSFWSIQGSTKIKKLRRFYNFRRICVLGGERRGRGKKILYKDAKQPQTFLTSYELINISLLIMVQMKSKVLFFLFSPLFCSFNGPVENTKPTAFTAFPE